MDFLEEEQYFLDKSNAAKRKIFISHSSRDRQLVTSFVEVLEGLGMSQEHIFCSSVPGYKIPLGEDIYEYLRGQFLNNDLYVIFFLSGNYYSSPACLNEMGAAWALRSEYLTVMLPGFTFREIKGAVNPNRIALDLNVECRDRLNDLKEKLGALFSLEGMPLNRWERCRERFLAELKELSKEELSMEKQLTI